MKAVSKLETILETFMIDRTTKILLVLIAAGLWANLMTSYVRSAVADDYSSVLRDIKSDLHSIY
jgi:hypothetical protein